MRESERKIVSQVKLESPSRDPNSIHLEEVGFSAKSRDLNEKGARCNKKYESGHRSVTCHKKILPPNNCSAPTFGKSADNLIYLNLMQFGKTHPERNLTEKKSSFKGEMA